MSYYNGYYKVGEKIFADKLEAILYANTTLADITWNFHDEVYQKVNWLEEPETSLDDFYRMRAQQIRDQYDYVVVMCSGGGDSTNVLWSFLNNGIMIDEVIAGAPLSGLRDWNNTKETSAVGTISETKLAQLPLMDEIAQKHPSVRLTLHDYFQNMVNYKTDEWLYRSGDWIHPTSVARYDLENLTHLKLLAEQGKKIGIVYGIDKPILLIGKDDNIYSMLGDLPINVPRPPFKQEYPNVDIVLFYYTPDLPLMQVKQAHVTAKWLHQPEQAKGLHFTASRHNVKKIKVTTDKVRNSVYERYIIPCIYPSTYRPIFQAAKPTRNFLGEHDAWFYQLHDKTNTFEMIDSDFRNFIKHIDKKYMNWDNSGGFEFFMKIYNIGPISKFKPLFGD